MEQYGTTGGNWMALPIKAGLNRCGKTCILRWFSYLRYIMKLGEFLMKEDKIKTYLLPVEAVPAEPCVEHRTILSPFTKEYRVRSTLNGIRLVLKGSPLWVPLKEEEAA